MKIKSIGYGSFTKAYTSDSHEGVILVSWDKVREIQALGFFPESPLFPIVQWAGDELNTHMLNRTRNTRPCETYLMPYYGKVTAPKKQLNNQAYQIYKVLRRIASTNNCHGYNKLFKLFDNAPLPIDVKNALLDALNGLSDYGADICFEISPRNISISDSGGLVLRDCFFFKHQLAETIKI